MTILKKFSVLLAREIKNPLIRTAVINGALTVVVAAGDEINAQLTSGQFNASVLWGAVVLAAAKWAHSAVSVIVAKAEAQAALAAVSGTGINV